MNHSPNVEIDCRNGVTLLTPVPVSRHATEAVFAEVLSLTAEAQPTLLVVDLRHIDHLPTASARQLLELRQLARRQGTALRICNLQDHAHLTLTLTRIRSLFEIHESEQSALVA